MLAKNCDLSWGVILLAETLGFTEAGALVGSESAEGAEELRTEISGHVGDALNGEEVVEGLALGLVEEDFELNVAAMAVVVVAGDVVCSFGHCTELVRKIGTCFFSQRANGLK